MKPYLSVPLAGIAVVGLGAVAAAAAELLPGLLGILAVGAQLCLVVFVLWPHVVLPVGIVGGTVASGALADGHVSLIVAVHAGILATGCLALLFRRAVVREDDRSARTAADGLMLAVAAFVLIGAVYGLARGNPSDRVAVAAYEFAVIPSYFFLATRTLGDSRALSKAAMCYLAGATGLAAAELTVPGRHGGLLSALALPPLLVAVGRARGWQRAGLVVVAAVAGADVVLAAYRAIWLAAGLALLIMLIRCTGQVRRTVVTTAACGAVLLPLAVAAVPALQVRASLVGKEFGQSSGYRLPEAAIGLHVFGTHPILGAGIGQVTPGVYLPNFAVTTVGPVYHVFYVMILANAGLVGLLLILRPLLRAVRIGLAACDDQAVAFVALTCGFVAAAVFAGPADGHWELGLLPALALLAGRGAASSAGPRTSQGKSP
ncbi:O-antigen ligase family protein [Streptantibioticus ferralitis]|uniref:O-antigen ligase family protein n=1 Tax=Streptantibioticus ferralitis TaxID=236510 RepID=A0ABT5Z0U0_9ACTN|nr:O-antigen ligase family protein [Streptantibioticus ferralitis]MDF2257452.1 O-antigen ligase family protein [Streptantibioticus ferralitis]